MLWLSMAHVDIDKFHKFHNRIKTGSNDFIQVHFARLNERFKSRKPFRDAFQCQEMNENELKLLSDSYSKFTDCYRVRSFLFDHDLKKNSVQKAS